MQMDDADDANAAGDNVIMNEEQDQNEEDDLEQSQEDSPGNENDL